MKVFHPILNSKFLIHIKKSLFVTIHHPTHTCHPWQEKVALAKAMAYLFLAEDLLTDKILGQEMLKFSKEKLSISYQG